MPEQEASECSFCGKSTNQVEKMISAREGLAICNECNILCSDLWMADPDSVKYLQDLLATLAKSKSYDILSDIFGETELTDSNGKKIAFSVTVINKPPG